MFIVLKRPAKGTATTDGARRLESTARPHIHPDEDLAIAEAERLVKTVPGMEFVVFKAIVIAQPKETPTEVVRL
jgi:hypothetical protein